MTSDVLSQWIIESDEVRILSTKQDLEPPATGYLSNTVEGKRALAKIVSLCTMKSLGASDPTGGGGVASASYMQVVICKEQQTMCRLVIIGDSLIVKFPEKCWFDISFSDAPMEDPNVDPYKALIELRVLTAMKHWVDTGSWKATRENLADFLTQGLLK